MKHCRNCGAEVEEDDVYCGFCGSKLKEENLQEETSSKQDFKAESFEGEDFKSDFDKEFERNDGFDNINNDRSDVERENDFHSSSPTNNAQNHEHKQLLSNKEAKDANTYGILALIFGILGGILGIVFGILGLVKSKKALELCNTGEYDGKPKASNGRILSIVGLVLSAITILFYII